MSENRALLTPQNTLPQNLRWLEEVQALQRSIVSEGFEQTLEVIERLVGDGFKRHAFPCGSEVFTWIVPPRWKVRGATIKANGKTLVDVSHHPLHLLTHSAPFRGTVTREELLQHLYTDPDRPEAIPYKFSFYQPKWGFCIPHQWLDQFTADRYDVVIDTELSNQGELVIGEVTLAGQSPRRIVFSAHLDHPGQVNDGLSAVAALIELIRIFRGTGGYRGYFTLTFLFTCETIGALCYLQRFENDAKQWMEGCIAPDILANRQPLAFAESFSGDTQLDRAAQCIFTERFGEFVRQPFLYLAANDDQVFDGPGFLIPSLSIARFPYREYHSSLDSLNTFDPDKFTEAVSVMRDIVELLNRNVVPHPLFKNIPFLTRYGIWFEWCSIPVHRNPLEKFLRLMDGKHSLVDLCVESGLSLPLCEQFLGTMRVHNLVACDPPPPIKVSPSNHDRK